MSKRFKLPTTEEEVIELQRETSKLRREHRVRIALGKLSPRGATVATQQAILERHGTDTALFAAAGKPSEATIERYLKTGRPLVQEAMDSGSDVWKLVEQRAGVPKTWYALKAAVQYTLIEAMLRPKQLIDAWFSGDKALRSNPSFRQGFADAPVALVALANALDSTPVGGLPPKFAGLPTRSVNSKSASIRGKPEDWRERVASKLEGRLKLAYLIQAVTGCRNQEMVNGAEVVLSADGMLEFSIVCAKVRGVSGEQMRSYKVSTRAGGVAAMLAEMLSVDSPLNAKDLLVGEDRDKVRDAYRKAVARASQAAFKVRKGTQGLSAYSLRHQMKRDASRSLSREDLAKAMGHTNTRSACAYGNGARVGNGAVTPLDVKATRPVKQRESIQRAHRKAAAPESGAVTQRARKVKP